MFVIDLPEAGEKVCVGSDHGWVVTVQLNGSINVVNPLTRARFALPPRYKFFDVVKHRPDKVGHEYLMKDLGLEPGYKPWPPDTYDAEWVRNCSIHKIALSCAPTSAREGDFRVAAIYGETRRLAYCKLRDKKWTDIPQLDKPCSYFDITFCGGKLYTLNHDLDLMVYDDIVSCPELRKLIPASRGFRNFCGETHLVNVNDKRIMMVCRMRLRQEVEVQNSSESQQTAYIQKTYEFRIFTMNPSGERWVCIRSLAFDVVLFMGIGRQVYMRGTKQGMIRKRKLGNQIYFTDHCLNFTSQEIEDPFDQGIFSFNDKQNIKSLGYEIDQKMIFPSPIWFTPNPD